MYIISLAFSAAVQNSFMFVFDCCRHKSVVKLNCLLIQIIFHRIYLNIMSEMFKIKVADFRAAHTNSKSALRKDEESLAVGSDVHLCVT